MDRLAVYTQKGPSRQVVAHAQVVEDRPFLWTVSDASSPRLAGFKRIDRAADYAQHFATRHRAADAAHNRRAAIACDQTIKREPCDSAHFCAPT